MIGAAGGDVIDTTVTEIPFSIVYDPAIIDDGFDYTLSAKVYDADGNLIYINDTVTPGIIEGQAQEDIVVQVQDVPAGAVITDTGEVVVASPAA